jgi:ferredoxin
MGKLVLAVFSGTGNASRAAGIISDALARNGRNVETVDLAAGGRIPAFIHGDLLVVCASTLGFSVPSTVMEALKTAPRSAGAEAAIACVCGSTGTRKRISGGWSGAAATVALSVLKRRGFEPVGSADVSYPENWTQMAESARGDAAAAMLERGDAESSAFAGALANGQRAFLRRNILTHTLFRFIGFVFRHLARMFLGKLYIADDTCTSCGFCARVCPSGAIAMRGGLPAWSVRCSACNRCINACPSSSIQTSTARLALIAVGNIAAIVASPSIASLILRAIRPGLEGGASPAASIALILAVYGALSALQLGPLDALVRILERSRALRRFFTASFTRRFARYLAPGFKPDKRA